MDPVFAVLYRVRSVPHGPVLGKRFGYTQNLGPSQCREHGTKRPYRWPVAPPLPLLPTSSPAVPGPHELVISRHLITLGERLSPFEMGPGRA